MSAPTALVERKALRSLKMLRAFVRDLKRVKAELADSR